MGLQMFRRCVKLQSEGREDEPEFRKTALVLHRRLALRPWQPNVLDVDDEPPDNPGNIRLTFFTSNSTVGVCPSMSRLRSASSSASSRCAAVYCPSKINVLSFSCKCL